MSVDQSILGADAVTGDSGAVTALADHLRSRAGLVDDIRSRLTGGHPASWTGNAAAAYKSTLGDLPVEMNKLTNSYHRAADILKHYAHALHTCKLLADKLAIRLEDETTALGTAQTAASDAKFKVGQAQAFHDLPKLHPADKADAARALSHAATAADHATAQVTHIEGEIASLHTAAATNHKNFKSAVAACCRGLHGASVLGIRNKHYSGLENFLHGLDNLAGSVLHFLGNLLDDLSDVADIAVIVAAIATVGAGILAVLTDGAATPLFLASLDALDAAGSAKLRADAAEVLAGRKDKSILLEDVLGAGAGKGIGRILPERTLNELDNALATAHPTNPGQQKYIGELRKLVQGKITKVTGLTAAEKVLSPALAHQLEGIIKGSGCGKHSAHVPAHA